MTPKDKRTIESDLAVLFSPRALVVLATIEEWKKVGFFHPSIRTETHTFPLTEERISALRRIISIVQKIPEIRDSCSRDEIAAEVHHSYESWIKQLLHPGQPIDEVLSDLLIFGKAFVQKSQRCHVELT